MTVPSGINLIFHSVRPGGGMERYVLDLIAGLARRGMRVRVVTRRLNWPGLPEMLNFTTTLCLMALPAVFWLCLFPTVLKKLHFLPLQ